MKTFKKILIPIVILLLLVGAFFGAKLFRHKTVSAEVIPVEMLNMNWFSDETTLDGMVYDSDSQQVHVSATQIITDIYVTKGQEVKAGDPLISFDMTSQEITLQLMELSVLRAENDLANAYAELRRLQNTTPIPEPTPMPEPEPEPEPTPIRPAKKQVEAAWNYFDGEDKDIEKYYLSPIILHDNTINTNSNSPTEQPSEYANDGAGDDSATADGGDESMIGDTDNPPEDDSIDAGRDDDKDNGKDDDKDNGKDNSKDNGKDNGKDNSKDNGNNDGNKENETQPIAVPEAGTLYNPLRYLVAEDGRIYGSFLNKLREEKPKTYVVIEVRSGNTLTGPLLASWTLYTSLLTEQDPDSSWSVAMRPLEDDAPTLDDLNGIEDDFFEYQSGYTASELAAAIYYQQRLIKDLDLSLRRSRLNLNIHKEQMADGTVRAKRDGTVTELGDPNNMPQDGSAFLKVESGKGMVVQGGISELLLDKVQEGQEIMATSWETGQTYLGEITSIDEYPMENNYYYYGGNPNSSTYGFLAYFEDANDLSTGGWLQLTLPSSQDLDSIYLPAAYIRSDHGGKYIMKDDDGKLKKQYVRCGKSFYGEYTQILEGITTEDYIAFPYGDGAIEGAKTVISEGMDYYW